jgi:two-component system, chemotaxis family, sensor kinase CheA
MNPLLEQFLQEARENLSFIDQNLESIGSNDPELINAIFRAAHTLKGGSGIVGFESVKMITHHAEDLLDMLRSGQIEFKEEMLESLYSAFDEVMNLVEAAEETEDIVDADEDVISQIVNNLNRYIGKSTEEEAWEVPFNLLDNKQTIIDLPMNFLHSLDITLPFELDSLDQSVIDSEQLYCIYFDVDETCMIYGNDPLYALSLLGNKVKGVYSCISEEGAKAILSGMDDSDGMNMYLQMTTFIYATYAEIEDALFNFIDELQFMPLDVATLLQVNKGESGHSLDLLKELLPVVLSSLKEKNREVVALEVEKSLTLIGKDTLQYTQLERLIQVLPSIEENDFGKLESFFKNLPNGNVYSPLPKQGDEEENIHTEESMVFDTVTPVKKELDEYMLSQINEILQQQLLTLKNCEGDDTFERVSSILLTCLAPFIEEMPSTFDSRDVMKEWIEDRLQLSGIKNPLISAEISTPIEEVITESNPSIPQEVMDIAKKETVKKSVIGKTVKIEQESVDNLMNIVGELLVAKNSLPYLADGVAKMSSDMISRAIMEKYTFINRLAEQLQDIIMSMRMLPISYVFDRYPKLVRDISKNLGKKVDLKMEGGETKLDKNMIEMLADPMIHIMRNSLDHGIESPEVREQKGKTPEGNISLNAYAQSDKIIIEIKDDGAGINVDKVINKVLEKDLATIAQIDAMSEDEKAELVMLPGLSTVDSISEYSGRGVGMDVVRKSIEMFGGTIRIKTSPNAGTSITLMIPLSLAVTSLLHVSMSGVHYGFPMDSVSETVKIEKEEIEYLHNEPFVYIRGEVIPLLFIKSTLDEKSLEGKSLPIVVLNIKGNLLAVVVNELLGQLDVVQKPLEGIMANHPIFSGTALLGNGQIIMAIDPLGVLGIAHVLKNDTKVNI